MPRQSKASKVDMILKLIARAVSFCLSLGILGLSVYIIVQWKGKTKINICTFIAACLTALTSAVEIATQGAFSRVQGLLVMLFDFCGLGLGVGALGYYRFGVFMRNDLKAEPWVSIERVVVWCLEGFVALNFVLLVWGAVAWWVRRRGSRRRSREIPSWMESY